MEQRLLDDMSEKYGSEFVIDYNNSKPLWDFKTNNLKSLPSIQIDFDLNNETETRKFIEDHNCPKE